MQHLVSVTPELAKEGHRHRSCLDKERNLDLRIELAQLAHRA